MILVNFITLSGLSGAGKDTIGNLIISKYKFKKIAIADPLKKMVQDKYGLSYEQLWGEFRNTIDDRYNKSPRQIYQEEGDLLRKKDPLALIKLWEQDFLHKLQNQEHIICTDVRTIQELETAKKWNALCILLKRKTSGAPGILGQHCTEVNLVSQEKLFDCIIENNSSVEDALKKIEEQIFL